MFDFVEKKRRVVQIIMGMATLPFLFWGIESYRNAADGGDYVAIVEGEKIQRQEFDQELRKQQENMRGALGENFRESMLDAPELRLAVVERLVQQRLLKREAARIGMIVPDKQLAQVLKDIPAFQQDGKFSNARYEELLRDQGMKARVFEERVRQEMMQQQLTDIYTRQGFMSETVAEKIIRLAEERREVSLVHIQPAQFLSQMRADEATVRTYYESHQEEFRLPEQARIEYLVLSLDELSGTMVVESDEAVRYFEEHRADFGDQEERHASHILINLAAGASDKDKAEARSKAERVLAEIRQSPQNFAELAKKHSQDPGSAEKGGDLGFFGRGMMVKAFEDVVFRMNPEQISDVVESDFGFHIIKLLAIKNGGVVRFEDVKDQVMQQVKKQKAARTFNEMAESFNNLVYEQNDSLQPAASKFGLTIRKSDWISRKASEPAMLANERLLQAVFSEDAVRNKRNIEAVEVSPNVLVSARVVEHKPAAMRSLEEAKADISEAVIQRQASDKAVQTGKEALAQLQKGQGQVASSWGEVRSVTRREAGGLNADTLRTVFRVQSASLPAYTGMTDAQGGGYTLVRVSRIIEGNIPERSAFESLARQVRQLISQEELSAYLAALRKRADVTVSQQSIEKKQ